MNLPDLSTNQQNPNKKHLINMTSWLRNQRANLYNGVSAPVAGTQDALAERLENICETASILNNRMMDNIEYG